MDDPSVVLRVASVSAGAKGGKIRVNDEGSIDATFPASGNYSVHASQRNMTSSRACSSVSRIAATCWVGATLYRGSTGSALSTPNRAAAASLGE